MVVIDCTLRDGGYYNSWDFDRSLIEQYLDAMAAAGVNVVELGLRSLENAGFKGACAYTTDSFICGLNVPVGLQLGVMVNASEIVGDFSVDNALQRLFPKKANESPLSLVRIASHVHEFSAALPAVLWLKENGYKVGFNLMQIADRSEHEIKALAEEASSYPLDVLYFADSMGSMNPDQTAKIISWLRTGWSGALGIHTHDNLGLALSNTLRAIEEGVTWVDSTVTGMGRGPGNARTEELVIEVADQRGQEINMIPLMKLVREHFKPMQQHYGWGTNPYYYLAGKYGIHPTYIQHMLSDSRFSEEDMLAVIEHLRKEGGKKFSLETLDAARHFYRGEATGSWAPRNQFSGRDVLLLGTGPGVAEHQVALEYYIRQNQPIVLALNTQSAIAPELINYRVACHPVRLLADCEAHTRLPQPLITPYSMLPDDVKAALGDKHVLDFGLNVEAGKFQFYETHCTTPSSLVMAYAFSVAASGQANRVILAGFDGYEGEDARNQEMNRIVLQFKEAQTNTSLLAITPSRYDVERQSVYGLSI